MAEPRSSGGVQSVERVFELLDLLADAGGSMTLSELASQTELPLPTIHRLLRTLVNKGHVRQLANRRYALGPRLIRLGEGASKQLGAMANPQLASLVSSLSETANMALLEGDRVLYVAQVPSPHAMRMFTEVGRRVHTHSSGVGKAVLAQLDDRDALDIVTRAGMPKATEHSIATPEALLHELATIRERGYAIDDNEQEIGVRCFAVPVPGAPTPTAISVSGPVSRVDESFGERAVPLLQRAAAVIGDELSRAEG